MMNKIEGELSRTLYKFRTLQTSEDLNRIKQIVDSQKFYCTDILNFNDMNEGVYTHNKNNDHITLAEKQNYKICSFSEKEALNNELMWGHYANAGKGIAIEVTIPLCSISTDKYSPARKRKSIENILQPNQVDSFLYQVKYSKNKKCLNTIKDILTNKSTVWEYEREWRYLKKQSENYTENIGKISKIYFGTPYENLSNYVTIKDNHSKLGNYLELKRQLEEYCEEKTIICENYNFNFKI